PGDVSLRQHPGSHPDDIADTPDHSAPSHPRHAGHDVGHGRSYRTMLLHSSGNRRTYEDGMPHARSRSPSSPRHDRSAIRSPAKVAPDDTKTRPDPHGE